ncbi:hypothetical protein Y032_0002g867 [Ancylostoma ceylanicum]|uniref:Uncharacterized protein n=1 Tax=Ancylostoma ceylanicum TaxID=53326 RepID=A0A016W1Y6_9BILA|nr:hypothetical protein Y032_0002g867 [Ancylostoma ceylanicum]
MLGERHAYGSKGHLEVTSRSISSKMSCKTTETSSSGSIEQIHKPRCRYLGKDHTYRKKNCWPPEWSYSGRLHNTPTIHVQSLSKRVDGLLVRFHGVAASESRRDLLDSPTWSIFSPPLSPRSRNGSAALESVYLFEKECMIGHSLKAAPTEILAFEKAWKTPNSGSKSQITKPLTKDFVFT